MTYFGFHARYTLPWLLLTGVAAHWLGWTAEAWGITGLILAIVMVATTPWDNYAAYHRIWDFAPGRYWFRIGWLPVEEYLFFVIQSLLVLYVAWIWRALMPVREAWHEVDLAAVGVFAPLLALAGFWLALGLALRGRHGPGRKGHYSWHLLFWSVPIVLAQWIIGWPILLPQWDVVLVPVLLVGTWLVYADYRAVETGLWFFDPAQITGHHLFGCLPWEEVAFFYLTSLLVVQSLLLFLG